MPPTESYKPDYAVFLENPALKNVALDAPEGDRPSPKTARGPPTFLDDEAFDTTEAANFLKKSPRTLEQWRLKGVGPIWTRAGRGVLYMKSDLIGFLRSGRRQSTSEAA